MERINITDNKIGLFSVSSSTRSSSSQMKRSASKQKTNWQPPGIISMDGHVQGQGD